VSASFIQLKVITGGINIHFGSVKKLIEPVRIVEFFKRKLSFNWTLGEHVPQNPIQKDQPGLQLPQRHLHRWLGTLILFPRQLRVPATRKYYERQRWWRPY
jgi:hypothetical protein